MPLAYVIAAINSLATTEDIRAAHAALVARAGKVVMAEDCEYNEEKLDRTEKESK